MGGDADAAKTLTFPGAEGDVTVTLAATATAPEGMAHVPPESVNVWFTPQARGPPERVSTRRHGATVKNCVAGGGGTISTEPRSHAGPWGRAIPRWSIASGHAPALMAGLPGCSRCEGVKPPFPAMGVTSSGFAAVAPLAHG